MDLSALRGRWVLVTVDGRSLAASRGTVYFEITGHMITGYDGCNRFGANLTRPGQVRKGQRGCPPEAILLPLDLADPMRQLSRATIDGDELALPLPDGKGQALFKRGN